VGVLLSPLWWGPMPAWIDQSNAWSSAKDMKTCTWHLGACPVHTSHKAQDDPVSVHVNCHFVYMIRGHLLFS